MIDLFHHHADPDYDALVEQAMAVADTPLALYNVLYDAALGYMFNENWQQARDHVDRAFALLPQLADVDQPKDLPMAITIGIPLDGREPSVSMPAKGYGLLTRQLQEVRSIIDGHLPAGAPNQ
jgi:hypothetical protein